MREFRTHFYAKSPLMRITAVLYSIVFLVIAVFFFINMEVIIARESLALAYGFFVLCSLAMLVRSLFFIFETIVVDEDRQELRCRLLRKTIPFKEIVQIQKVRHGQLRIHTSKGIHPVSVEDEENFLLLLSPLINPKR